MRYTIAPFLLTLLSPLAASADYAFVVDKTVCDNQYVSFNVIWAKQKIQENLALFYFDGSNFTAIDHNKNLNDFSTVYVSYHGSAGVAAGGTTADIFALAFKKNHAATPSEVNFMACYSAKVNGKSSVVGALANQYAEKGRTLIGKLTGSRDVCALAKVSATAAKTIGEAGLYDKPSRTQDGTNLVTTLTNGWNNNAYPGSPHKFKEYCEKDVLSDPKKLPSFLNKVDDEFKVNYLKLINDNYNGSAIYICGDKTSNACQ